MPESNEQLNQRLHGLYALQREASKNYVPYWFMGPGIVLLVIGLLTYNSSAWGLLWMPGALLIAMGLVAHTEALRKSRQNNAAIAKIRAVLEDRGRSGG